MSVERKAKFNIVVNGSYVCECQKITKRLLLSWEGKEASRMQMEIQPGFELIQYCKGTIEVHGPLVGCALTLGSSVGSYVCRFLLTSLFLLRYNYSYIG